MAATQTASGNGYPASPPSPTLTNPDMILPYDDHGASPELSQVPLDLWKTEPSAGLGFPMSQGGFVAGPITPTTPIIYGNGTMLSDIGEVTEAESVVGKPSPLNRRHSDDSLVNIALRSSPTTGHAIGPYESIKDRARKTQERRASMESTSTITEREQSNIFADFDDSVSVDDSNFQGDDEESMASSYHYDNELKVPDVAVKPSRSNNTLRSEGRSEDRYSTISLSTRAEEILANAKRRLTTMEGNLSRARSINQIHSPNSGDSSTIGSSTPSPPMVRPSTSDATHMPSTSMTTTTVIDMAPSPATSTATTPTTPSHTRMMSETNMSLTKEIKAGVYPRRSASALGSAGGYRQPVNQPIQSSHSFDRSQDHDTQMRDSLSGGFDQANVKTNHHEPILSPLNEDEVPNGTSQDDEQGTKLDNFLSPTFGSFNATKPGEAPRAASAAQVRGLKDQMAGLKGKIAGLRQQARADSMKRRSLQSLRTPSPFTHASVEPWYAEQQKAQEQLPATAVPEMNPWDEDVKRDSLVGSQKDIDSESDMDKFDSPRDSIISEIADAPPSGLTALKPRTNSDGSTAPSLALPPVNGVRARNSHIPEILEDEIPDDNDDMKTEDGHQDDETDDDFTSVYESESEESVYHESIEQQISHEDREDAFDYEHFFLHSAMGTMSQARMQRSGSFSSEDSTETTRGPVVGPSSSGSRPAVDPLQSHSRSDSAASASTMASFATATEGRHSTLFEDAVEQVVSVANTNGNRRPNSGEKTPLTAKRTTFQPPVSNGYAAHKTGSTTSLGGTAKTGRSSLDEPRMGRDRGSSLVVPPRRPNTSQATYLHRPSVSSFESTGTTRSFPLVNKGAGAAATGKAVAGSVAGGSVGRGRSSTSLNGLLTPQGSPDSELRTISDSLMSETASICEGKAGGAARGGGVGLGAMDSLSKEDHILVQRLVESLGKCVLGLTENGRASPEARMYRRKLDAARRLLEGGEGGF